MSELSRDPSSTTATARERKLNHVHQSHLKWMRFPCDLSCASCALLFSFALLAGTLSWTPDQWNDLQVPSSFEIVEEKAPSSPTTVAILVYGLTRSLSTTHESIKSNILNQLTNNFVEYKIFMHMVEFVGEYSNARSGEKEITLNNTEWRLLPVDELSTMEHDIFLREEHEYITDIISYGDGLTNYGLDTRNTLEALHSLREAAKLAKHSGMKFQGIIIIRPDLLYQEPINLTELHFTIQNNIMASPAWQLHGGFNDRFAFGGWRELYHVATRYDLILQYCQTTNRALHPETFLKWIVGQGVQSHQSPDNAPPKIGVCFTAMKASRVRATGKVVKEDFNIDRNQLLCPDTL